MDFTAKSDTVGMFLCEILLNVTADTETKTATVTIDGDESSITYSEKKHPVVTVSYVMNNTTI